MRITVRLVLPIALAVSGVHGLPAFASAQELVVSVYSDVIPSADRLHTHAVASTQIAGAACQDGVVATSLEVFGPSAPLYAWSSVTGGVVTAAVPYAPGSYTSFVSVTTSDCGTLLTNAATRDLIDLRDPLTVPPVQGQTPPLIDGAVSPHLIDDRKAVPIVLRTLAVPEAIGPVARQRFMARASRMRLTPSDQALLEGELARLHGQFIEHYTRMAATREAARERADPRAASSAVTAAAQELGDLSLASYARLLNALSDEGATRLREYVDAARTRIRVFPQTME